MGVLELCVGLAWLCGWLVCRCRAGCGYNGIVSGRLGDEAVCSCGLVGVIWVEGGQRKEKVEKL